MSVSLNRRASMSTATENSAACAASSSTRTIRAIIRHIPRHILRQVLNRRINGKIISVGKRLKLHCGHMSRIPTAYFDCALSQGFVPIRDEQIGVDFVAEAESAALWARALGVVEGEKSPPPPPRWSHSENPDWWNRECPTDPSSHSFSCLTPC